MTRGLGPELYAGALYPVGSLRTVLDGINAIKDPGLVEQYIMKAINQIKTSTRSKQIKTNRINFFATQEG